MSGNGESELTLESHSLPFLNDLLARVSYRSTVYHVDTGDLGRSPKLYHSAIIN